MRVSYQEKIITLWAVFLLGTLFHTQLGLMPLFHNQNIAISDPHGSNMIWVLWLMLGFFTVPMFLMIATLFTDSRQYRKLHFSITILYSILNLTHLMADLLVAPIAWYQIVLMGVLFLVGLLLNWVVFQWTRQRNSQISSEHSISL